MGAWKKGDEEMRATALIGCLAALMAVWGCAPKPPAPEVEKPAPPPMNDKVVMHDGSLIVGRVLGVAEGKVTVKTDYAGTLVLDKKKVKGISMDRPMNVQTVKDKHATGVLTNADDADLTIAVHFTDQRTDLAATYV